MQFLFKQPTRRTLRWTNLLAGGAVLATGCGQDAHHLASIASNLGRQVATGSERVRETALGRLFQNRSVLEQVPLTDRARIRLRLDRNLNGLEISVRQIEAGCLELTGEVPDEAARQAAVQSVQQLPGVEKVADGLKLAGSTKDEEKAAEPNAVPNSAPPVSPKPATMPGSGGATTILPANSPTVPNPANPSGPAGSFPPFPAGGSPPPLPTTGFVPPIPGGNPVTIPPPPPAAPKPPQ